MDFDGLIERSMELWRSLGDATEEDLNTPTENAEQPPVEQEIAESPEPEELEEPGEPTETPVNELPDVPTEPESELELGEETLPAAEELSVDEPQQETPEEPDEPEAAIPEEPPEPQEDAPGEPEEPDESLDLDEPTDTEDAISDAPEEPEPQDEQLTDEPAPEDFPDDPLEQVDFRKPQSRSLPMESSDFEDGVELPVEFPPEMRDSQLEIDATKGVEFPRISEARDADEMGMPNNWAGDISQIVQKGMLDTQEVVKAHLDDELARSNYMLDILGSD